MILTSLKLVSKLFTRPVALLRVPFATVVTSWYVNSCSPALSLLPFCTSSSLRLRLPFPTSRTSYEEGSKRYNSFLAVMELLLTSSDLHLSSSDLHQTSSDLHLDSVYTGNSSIAACVSTSSVW